MVAPLVDANGLKRLDLSQPGAKASAGLGRTIAEASAEGRKVIDA